MLNLSDKFNCYQHAQARNDSSTRPWLRTKKETTPEEQQAWWENLDNDHTKRYWCVTDESLVVGLVGFTDIIVSTEAEFSCLIYPEFRKQGYGEKALRLLFDYGFKFMGLKRIYGWTYGYDFDLKMEQTVINPAMKLFEKIGMEIYGPCIYPETKEKLDVGQYVWRLEMQRYNYERINA